MGKSIFRLFRVLVTRFRDEADRADQARTAGIAERIDQYHPSGRVIFDRLPDFRRFSGWKVGKSHT